MLTRSKFAFVQALLLSSIFVTKNPLLTILGSILIYHLLYRAVFADTPSLQLSVRDKQLVNLGRKRASESSLTICSLLRNGVDGLESSWDKLIAYGGVFRLVRVFLFENDSTDGTRKLWLERKESAPPNVEIHLVNPVTFLLDEGEVHVPSIPKTELGPSGGKVTDNKRISKMVYLRNQCLKFLRSRTEPSDFVHITDMDIRGPTPSVEGVLNTIGYLTRYPTLDIVSFRGTRRGTGLYFDPYAFQSEGGSRNGFVQLISSITNSQDIPFNQGLYKCRSTFSGGIFMNWDRLPRCRYDLRVLAFDTMECEHVSLCHRFENVYVNTNMVMEVESH